MPTQKKKDKKVKEKSEPQTAVNIKQEPEEIKPLAGYIDDRLELIRQVFSCVKPKEIKYLLPDFLEGKSNDVIKERCLDELLGISTKRLRSIINNTKCPTDTESENSDVENIEEHISLDEISSDSDDDVKRSGKRNKKGDCSKQPDERNGEAKSEKEMTVLELLELQARARAIRSQLALEPVTKIEIDSEHEEDGRHGDIDTDDEAKGGPHRRTATKDGVAGSSGENGKQMKQEQLNQQQPRRVRLKRNFRIRQVGDDDDGDQDTSSNPASENVREKSTDNVVEIFEPTATEQAVVEVREEQKSPEKETALDESEKMLEEEHLEAGNEQLTEDATQKDVQSENGEEASKDPISKNPAETNLSPKRDADRESSLEVIPVEASPETLCISSDSEEERLAKQRASIFVPNIEELDRQAKEKPPPSPQQSAEDTEPEEGEISEDEAVVPPPAEEPSTVAEDQNATEKEDPSTSANLIESDENQANKTAEGTEASIGINKDDTSTEVVQTEATDKETEIHNLSSGSDESDTESDGSSSSSSTEQEEDGSKTVEQTKQMDTSAQDDADIVEIHDSGDENLLLEEKPVEEEEKSWNSRWLKSNRVAKVMAASRLGNKVREKLKKQKQKQQAEQLEQAATDAAEAAQPSPKPAEATAVAPELPANVEVGSVEHYRELVAQQESKD